MLSARGKPRLSRVLPALAFAALVAGIVGYALHGERRSGERRQRERAAQSAARAAVLGRGQLGEMLSLCRELWAGALGFNYEPTALAWTRLGVDAYFLQGTDTSSLRHVRCDASGASRGPRVTHPLARALPAEAPSTSDEPDRGEWLRAVERISTRSFGSGELAFELLRHPVTGGVVSRAWRAGAERAEATVDPEDAPAFAFLPTSAGFQPMVGAAPAPRPLARRRWVAEPEAAFALLEQVMPRGARVSELRLEEDQLEVSIDWPTPAFDGDAPAPYGDKTLDEYGIASMDYWYPRTSPGFGCAAGQPLAAVRSAFAEARARGAGQRLAWAWYSCSPAFSDGRGGVWHLVPASPQ